MQGLEDWAYKSHYKYATEYFVVINIQELQDLGYQSH